MQTFRVSKNNKQELIDYIDKIWDGDRLVVEVKKAGTHSQRQRGYYRGVCIKMIVEHSWYNEVDMFNLWGIDIMMRADKFIHAQILALLHKETSTDMDKEEYGQLIDVAIRLGHEIGVYIPPPQI